MNAPARPLVLLVDDSTLVTDALAVLLNGTGHDTRAAASVAEALRLARDETFDVALIDLTLPDGDGLEIVRALIDERRAPRAMVALMGHDDPDTEARCIAAGCRAVLAKPVRAATLLGGLKEWLAR